MNASATCFMVLFGLRLMTFLTIKLLEIPLELPGRPQGATLDPYPRKVLTPMISHACPTRAATSRLPKALRANCFPSQWTFTRHDLCALLAKLQPKALAAAA